MKEKYQNEETAGIDCYYILTTIATFFMRVNKQTNKQIFLICFKILNQAS